MKYALLDPKFNDASKLPAVSTTSDAGQTYLTLTYTKVPAATDLTYAVEASADLQTWSSGAGSTVVVDTVTNPDGQTQTVVTRDLTAQSTTAKRFMRLKVTSP